MKYYVQVILLHVGLFLSAAIAQSVKSDLASQRGLPGPHHHYMVSQNTHSEGLCSEMQIMTIATINGDFYSVKDVDGKQLCDPDIIESVLDGEFSIAKSPLERRRFGFTGFEMWFTAGGLVGNFQIGWPFLALAGIGAIAAGIAKTWVEYTSLNGYTKGISKRDQPSKRFEHGSVDFYTHAYAKNTVIYGTAANEYEDEQAAKACIEKADQMGYGWIKCGIDWSQLQIGTVHEDIEIYQKPYHS